MGGASSTQGVYEKFIKIFNWKTWADETNWEPG